MSFQSIFKHRHEVSQRRLAICRECEHYEPILTRCDKCGCIMSGKTLFMWAKCPIDKWGKENDK
jgi:hypothetical protein